VPQCVSSSSGWSRLQRISYDKRLQISRDTTTQRNEQRLITVYNGSQFSPDAAVRVFGHKFCFIRPSPAAWVYSSKDLPARVPRRGSPPKLGALIRTICGFKQAAGLGLAFSRPGNTPQDRNRKFPYLDSLGWRHLDAPPIEAGQHASARFLGFRTTARPRHDSNMRPMV
jgi:hypothetical protein